MQTIFRTFRSEEDVVAAIDISVPAPQRSVVSTRTGLKRFLQRYRERPDCTKGMKYALNQAIANLADSEPLTFEDCIGKPGFGNDPTRPVLRLVRQYFDEEIVDDDAGRESIAEVLDGDGTAQFNAPCHWKLCKAPSNRSTCKSCKDIIEAGAWRVELGSAAAIVSNFGGWGFTDYKHVKCFFTWLGTKRRMSTPGLQRLEDLDGFAAASDADKDWFRQMFREANMQFQQRSGRGSRTARPSAAAAGMSPARRRSSAAGASGSPMRPAAVAFSPRRRPDRSIIADGVSRALLRMCPREQMGDELRRAVRDHICDQNFDSSAAPRLRLDFEILVSSAAGLPPQAIFLIERKSFTDLFASQVDNRLNSQVDRLSQATEYRGRFVIVEAPDNDWKHDRTAEGYADFTGVKTMLQVVQSANATLDARRVPAVRVLRVRSPIETASAIQQLMKEALRVAGGFGASPPDGGYPPMPSSPAARRPPRASSAPGLSSPSLLASSTSPARLSHTPPPPASPVSAKRRRVEAPSPKPSPKPVPKADPKAAVPKSRSALSAAELERNRKRELQASKAEQRHQAHVDRGTAVAKSKPSAPASAPAPVPKPKSSVQTPTPKATSLAPPSSVRPRRAPQQAMQRMRSAVLSKGVPAARPKPLMPPPKASQPPQAKDASPPVDVAKAKQTMKASKPADVVLIDDAAPPAVTAAAPSSSTVPAVTTAAASSSSPVASSSFRNLQGKSSTGPIDLE